MDTLQQSRKTSLHLNLINQINSEPIKVSPSTKAPQICSETCFAPRHLKLEPMLLNKIPCFALNSSKNTSSKTISQSSSSNQVIYSLNYLENLSIDAGLYLVERLIR